MERVGPASSWAEPDAELDPERDAARANPQSIADP
jgi:hypothetical protein